MKHSTKLSQHVPEPARRISRDAKLLVRARASSAQAERGQRWLWSLSAVCAINDDGTKLCKYLATIWSVTASSRPAHAGRNIIHNAAPRYAKICALGTYSRRGTIQNLGVEGKPTLHSKHEKTRVLLTAIHIIRRCRKSLCTYYIPRR